MMDDQRNGSGNGAPAPRTTSAQPASAASPDARAAPNEPIAIIGIGCRFPGDANDPDSYWRLLEGGVDAISEVPSDRWNLRTFYDPEPGKPGETQARWGGFLKSLD